MFETTVRLKFVAFVGAVAIGVSLSLCSVKPSIADETKTQIKARANTAGATSRASRQPRSDIAQQEQGKALFKAYGCLDCHKINGKGCPDGVDLSDVGSRRSTKFLTEQIKDPESHVQKNKRSFNFNTSVMADSDLSPKEISTIASYLRTLKRHAPVPKAQ